MAPAAAGILGESLDAAAPTGPASLAMAEGVSRPDLAKLPESAHAPWHATKPEVL